jgi:hypothetical protein
MRLSAYAKAGLMDFAISGKYICAVSQEQFEILDAKNPASIQRVGLLKFSGGVQESFVAMSGSLAYVRINQAGGTRTSLLIDISDVANPKEISSAGEPLPEWRPPNVAVFGTYAFTTHEYFLSVEDVSNGRRLGEWRREWEPMHAIALSENFAYVGVGPDLRILRFRFGLPQTMQLNLPRSVAVGDSPFFLAARSSSGLPVSFSIESGPGRINEAELTFTGPGELVVRAEQAGDDVYLPASIQQTVLATHLVSIQGQLIFPGLFQLAAIDDSGRYLFAELGLNGVSDTIIDVSDSRHPRLADNQGSGAAYAAVSGNYGFF